MKKIISVLLAVVMTVSVLAVGAFAWGGDPDAGIMPINECYSSVYSSISNNNKTVTCTSKLALYSGEKWIAMSHTIESLSSGRWTSTSNSWSKTADNQSVNYTLSSSTTLSASGTYRLKSVAVILLPNGSTETITSYSGTISI